MKKGCLYVLFALVAFIFMGTVVTKCNKDSSERSHVENYNDNSLNHQILAKNYLKDYIKKNYIKDPDSFEEVSYSSIYNYERNCYVVDLKYRAKNSLGGYVLERIMADVTFSSDGKTVSYGNIERLE